MSGTTIALLAILSLPLLCSCSLLGIGHDQFARINTPGERDGILRGWVDGLLAFEKTDVQMRSVEGVRIESIWLDVYYGGKAVPEPITSTSTNSSSRNSPSDPG